MLLTLLNNNKHGAQRQNKGCLVFCNINCSLSSVDKVAYIDNLTSPVQN